MGEIFRLALIAGLTFAAVVLLLKPVSRRDEETAERMARIAAGGREPGGRARTPAEITAKRRKKEGRAEKEGKTEGQGETAALKKPAVRRLLWGAAASFPALALCSVLHRTGLDAPAVRLLPAASFAGGTLLPAVIRRRRERKRREAVVSSLTDAIDLIAVSVEAGLGYDAAIINIWKEDRSPAMQELMRTIGDIGHGMSRHDAYHAMAARCGSEEITMFAGNMLQADAMGVPVTQVLKNQAEALRASRRRRAEEQVQKAPVRMLLPLVLFVFPNMLLVLLGPAMIRILTYM